jgi:membrane protease YdiL (CAAX protease family)
MGTDLYKVEDASTRLQTVLHSLGLIVGSFAMGIVLAIIAFSFVGAFGISVDGESTPVWINVLATVLQFVGFYLVCLWYLQWRGDSRSLFEFHRPSLRDLGWVVLGFLALIVGVNILSSLVLQFLGVETATNAVITEGRQNPSYFLYLIPIAFLFNAPAEELLFRGVVQGLFRNAYGVVPGVVIASVLFGAVHITALFTSGASTLSLAVTIAITIVLGLVLGALYERTKNLFVPILAHGLYNALLFYIQWLDATGQISLA